MKEYKVITFNETNKNIEETLNKYALEGWQAILMNSFSYGASHTKYRIVYTLERYIENKI